MDSSVSNNDTVQSNRTTSQGWCGRTEPDSDDVDESEDFDLDDDVQPNKKRLGAAATKTTRINVQSKDRKRSHRRSSTFSPSPSDADSGDDGGSSDSEQSLMSIQQSPADSSRSMSSTECIVSSAPQWPDRALSTHRQSYSAKIRFGANVPV